MRPKYWNNLPESRTRSIMRGFVLTVVILFLAVLCCLTLLVILMQQITDLRNELANVHKQLHVFNKRTRVNVEDSSMLHEKEMEDLPENLKNDNNARFQIREQLTTLNDNSHETTSLRRRRDTRPCEKQLSFLQLMPDTERSTIQQAGDSTFIPWTVASQKGEALAKKFDNILVKEEGFYTVYSQVLYYDNCMVMGHVVRRKKINVTGNEKHMITLFRCIQNMPNNTSSNSCFTAGIVKLDKGDELELVLPSRPHAQISMEKDSTFFGVIQLL
ncbi:tumor necrosis factor ligand superfamily member 13B-like isoform X1 [Mobula hypostoma]|uniref:tumor necrosis factor ligand superfamily member 13B-like isoform X1 n=1 Tax=Mobula hypostoma TaxID=723540 RepID=UPI002FC37CF6